MMERRITTVKCKEEINEGKKDEETKEEEKEKK